MKKAIPILCCLAVILIACITNPETGKKHMSAPDGIMNSLGAQAYTDVLQKETLSSNARLKGIVDRVSQRIADASGVDFDWEFNLVESPQANAFCLPGGKIVVYTGILPVCETEAGLAFVVGHEVAHAVARHGGQRVLHNVIAQGVQIGTDFVLQDSPHRASIMGALGVGSQVGVLLPFSRKHESEADWMGLRYMARAGYDPDAAVGFWPRMGRLSGGEQPPEFLSTHPSHETREADIQAAIEDARRIYAESPNKYGTGERIP